ncbi:alpha/beta fold hydrolase [Amycolatopsis circi]|uniref:alpha/beta fold hydrolase n=1 Tax=Amycolatopsis circi TaxID=871959 RepID=UPI000E26DB70|nr:alpha/beta fold hydrolase [Amycolatopsis circi]
MTTYVLVPGACHGGWCFDRLTGQLRDRGHRVLPLTLTGLSERQHLLHSGVNLDTHIEDVVRAMQAEQVERAVLVGHSYGGMVITGAADQVPELVDSLVYLDAFVPENGDSCWTLTDDRQREWYLSVGETGYSVPPLPFFDPRASAHPLASLLQSIRLNADLSRFRRRDYVYARIWDGGSPFEPTYRPLLDDPQWNVHGLESKHDLMRDAPEELLRILLSAAS